MIIIIIIYLTGCILSYMRCFASVYAIEEKSIEWFPPSLDDLTPYIIIITLLSWVGFLIGIVLYFMDDKPRYFFKWSFKKLWDKWNNKHQLKQIKN